MRVYRRTGWLSCFTAFGLSLILVCFALMPASLIAENSRDSVFMEADGIFQLAKIKMKQKKYGEAEQ